MRHIQWVKEGQETPTRCPFCRSTHFTQDITDKGHWTCNNCGRDFELRVSRPKEPDTPIRRIKTPEEIWEWRRRQNAENEARDRREIGKTI